MFRIHVLIAATVITLTGCATGLDSTQHAELRHYRANGLAIEEKSPAGAAALGLLPGGGSFYGRAYGHGIANLLLWPVSIMWDPVSGYNAAEAINYQASRAHAKRLKGNELTALEEQLSTRSISESQYRAQERRIQEKFGNDS